MGGLETVTREAYYTRHGPVIRFDPERGVAYSVALEGLGNVKAVEQLYRMNIARSLDEFKSALRIRGIMLWNILYADVDGNLYYVYNAAIHEKSEKYNHRRPRPGWREDAQWGDIIPFDELPQVENPPSGFIQNNNVMPWLVTIDPGIGPDDYPGYLVNREGSMNDRALRTFQVLSSKSRLTPGSCTSWPWAPSSQPRSGSFLPCFGR